MTVSKIPLVAVIGHPISHSKSPRLHGNWLKKLGLPGHYIPVDVEPVDFGNVLKTMPKMGFVGANVTIPHKHLALTHADHVSGRGRPGDRPSGQRRRFVTGSQSTDRSIH